MSTKTRIGLVDDHDSFRRILVEMINRIVPNFTVTIEASNGKEFIAKLQTTENSDHPDLVIMDINMPIMNGFETANWLHSNFPNIKVVALSMNNDESSVIRMINFGVAGYIHKNIDGPDLISAMESVLKTGAYFNDHITPGDINSLSKENPVKQTWNTLSEKEQAFVKLCCTELNYTDIAIEMEASFREIDLFKENVFGKFEVKGRIGMVLMAVKYGLC
jgi:two-component system invasion response regulator UvrY